jgi:hexosaminidase
VAAFRRWKCCGKWGFAAVRQELQAVVILLKWYYRGPEVVSLVVIRERRKNAVMKRDSHRGAHAPGAWHALMPALSLGLACVLAVLASLPAGAATAVAPVRIAWEALPSAPGAKPSPGEAPTRALLAITNTGTRSLPANGWSIWFTCMAGLEEGAAGEAIVVERSTGTLYRLRPAPGFPGLAAGATLVVPITHASAVGNPTKALEAPWFSLDATPAEALAIGDYQRKPMPDEPGYVTPVQLYDRYAALQPTAPVVLPPVFPAPREWQAGEGVLHWNAIPIVQAPAALEHEARAARALLAAYLRAEPAATGKGTPGIALRLGQPGGSPADGASAEAYELVVDARTGVTITAPTAAGVALGLASFHELLPVSPAPATGVTLQAMVIRDAPRFGYRGLMLDVARNFQPAAQVERVLGLMARYKLNTLHLHLVDDEGWRLEIAGIPELTDFGARRGAGGPDADHLPPAQGSGPDLGNPYGSGHYTRSQYQAILRHAAALHIEVVPEIEMPGHARAAVKAMAWRARQLALAGKASAPDYRLDDPADTSVYRSAQLYTDNVMNPALPSTYAFIEHVVDELVAMHREAGVPLRTIHMGGDELPARAWSASPAVTALMAREGLHERADVWQYFYRRVGALLARRGLHLAGWEEIASPDRPWVGEPPTAWVWNTRSLELPDDGRTDLAVRLANAGFGVVLAPASRYYFDLMHLLSPDEPGHDWAGHTELDTAFDFVPFDPSRARPLVPTRSSATEPLTASGRAHIRGLEGTLFSELVHEPGRIDTMLMPRLLALAERAWSPDPAWATERDATRAQALYRADWARFAAQVGTRVLPRLDAEGAGIRYRIPPPGLKREADGVHANSLLPGFTLRYTSDGSEPATASAAVAGPITAQGTIRVAAFARDGRAGRSSSIDPTNR